MSKLIWFSVFSQLVISILTAMFAFICVAMMLHKLVVFNTFEYNLLVLTDAAAGVHAAFSVINLFIGQFVCWRRKRDFVEGEGNDVRRMPWLTKKRMRYIMLAAWITISLCYVVALCVWMTNENGKANSTYVVGASTYGLALVLCVLSAIFWAPRIAKTISVANTFTRRRPQQIRQQHQQGEIEMQALHLPPINHPPPPERPADPAA